MSLVHAYNEWDPLEEIIVRTALHASIPIQDKGFEAMQKSTKDLFNTLPIGRIPEKIINEAEEDIAIFVEELEKLNIIVAT